MHDFTENEIDDFIRDTETGDVLAAWFVEEMSDQELLSCLAAIRERALAAGATQFVCAVFAEKDLGKPKPIAADFVGVKLPDRYVFGYGMDVKGAWRNLPAIYAIKPGEVL